MNKNNTSRIQSFYKTPTQTKSKTKKIAIASALTGLTVALSTLYIPMGATKCFPAQHMINGIAGVLLGPYYAVLMAFLAGAIRNLLGLGTIYAFPGGVPGALVVGVAHRYFKHDQAALLEPIGTVVVGATLSALLFAPMLSQSLTLYFFWAAFAVSSVPGAVLGYVLLKALRRLGVDQLLL